MVHGIFAVKDSCANVYLMPMFFRNTPSATRALQDAVNKPAEDNQFYQHPEHYHLYHIGSYDDDTGDICTNDPVFIVDCASLVRQV